MEFLTTFPEVGNYSYVSSIQTGCLKGAWRVISKETQENFALQSIAKTSLISSEANARFNAQLFNIKQADNRYVSAFIELIEDSAAFHVITEIPDGISLKDHVIGNGPLSKEKVQELIGKILFIQAYLSTKLGMKYCEFNPYTIFVDESGSLTRYCIPISRSTTDPFLALFDPPEILIQNKVAPSSDMWSIGMIIYFCITGTLPFDCKTTAEVVKQVLNDKITFPSTLDPEIGLLLQKILVKNSFMRMTYQELSASEFLSTFSIEITEQRNERRSSTNAILPPRMGRSHNQSVNLTRSNSEANKHLIHLSYKANISTAKRAPKRSIHNLG